MPYLKIEFPDTEAAKIAMDTIQKLIREELGWKMTVVQEDKAMRRKNPRKNPVF